MFFFYQIQAKRKSNWFKFYYINKVYLFYYVTLYMCSGGHRSVTLFVNRRLRARTHRAIVVDIFRKGCKYPKPKLKAHAGTASKAGTPIQILL